MKPSIVVALAAVLVASVSASSDPPRCPDYDGVDVILLPNPDDCTKYYVCNEGHVIAMNCSKGLIFDAKKRVCTWGNSKTCVLRPDEEPSTTPPPKNPPNIAPRDAVQCPPHNGVDVTLLPNPNDCTTFYYCEEGVPILSECSAGLTFNPVRRVCDWGDVQCRNRPTGPPRPPPTTAPPQPEPSSSPRPSQNQVHCPAHNRGQVILVANDNDCTSFYSCNEGTPILMKCGEGLVFNPYKQVCDWGDVQCRNRPTGPPRPPPTTAPPQPEPSSSPRPSQNQVHCPAHNRGQVILVANDNDCTSFYSCNEGTPILMKCGEGLVFNPYKQVCDWGDVQCRNRPTGPPRPPPTTVPPQPEPSSSPRPSQNQVHCPAHNRGQVILVANDNDCTSFYSCNEGTPILMKCGEGLVFNPYKQVCDWGDVQCRNRPTGSPRPPPTTVPPQPEPSSSPRPSQNQVHCPAHNRGQVILVANDNDCTSFYSCNEGTPILMKCGEGLVFNPYKQVCDWGDVQCRNRPASGPSSPAVPTSPPELGPSSTPSSPREPDVLPKCPPHNGADVTLLPNPQDPTTFYSCDEGVPYLMHCGDGLVFNTRDRICEYSAFEYKHDAESSRPPRPSHSTPSHDHHHHHHTKTSTIGSTLPTTLPSTPTTTSATGL